MSPDQRLRNGALFPWQRREEEEQEDGTERFKEERGRLKERSDEVDDYTGRGRKRMKGCRKRQRAMSLQTDEGTTT